MPLLGNGEYKEPVQYDLSKPPKEAPKPIPPSRKQSQHSTFAKTAMSQMSTPTSAGARTPEESEETREVKASNASASEGKLAVFQNGGKQGLANGAALTDTPVITPATTAPSSPIIL